MTTDPEPDNPAADLPGYLTPDAPPLEDPAAAADEPERPSNVDSLGRAHFAIIYPDGQERCGGCNNPWPCDDAVHLLVLPNEALE